MLSGQQREYGVPSHALGDPTHRGARHRCLQGPYHALRGAHPSHDSLLSRYKHTAYTYIYQDIHVIYHDIHVYIQYI